MADSLDFDLNSLTIGEVEEIENVTDTPIDKLFSVDGKKGTMMRVIAYVQGRRSNPEFTWEEAGNTRIELDASALDQGKAQDAQ